MNNRTNAAQRYVGAPLLRLMLVLVLLGAQCRYAAPAVRAASVVGGPITQNTTWTAANSPYIVASASVQVTSGVTLTIESGVTVRFGAAMSLQVDGTLVARGTISSPVTFTSNEATPAKGDWGYIHFTDLSADAVYDAGDAYSGGSIIQDAVIEYAGGASVAENGALRIEAAAPCIDRNVIRNSRADGIRVWGDAGPRIRRNSIVDSGLAGSTTMRGIYADRSGDIVIRDNSVSNSMGAGIEVAGTVAALAGNHVVGSAGDGILINCYHAPGTSVSVESNVVERNAGNGINFVLQTGGSYTVIVSGNTARANAGAGIRLSKAWAGSFSDGRTILIDRNTASGNRGNGIRLADFSGQQGMTVSHNTVIGNSTQNTEVKSGGGISFYGDGPATLSSNVVRDNSSDADGGGIWVSGGGSIENGIVIANNVIAGNQASGDGGGIGTSSGHSPELRGNTIIGNTARRNGGGIHNAGKLFSYNNTVSGNTAMGDGGGIYYVRAGSIRDNTITNNTAGGKGGGVFLEGYTLAINRNDVYGNGAAIGSALYNSNPVRWSPNIDARDNYWGTTSPATIESLIWHSFDDSSLSSVDFIPYATRPFGPSQYMPLPLGTAVVKDLAQFAWQYYSVAITAGLSVLVEVTPLTDTQSLWLYGEAGEQPLGAVDGLRAVQKTPRGTYELLISPTQGGPYYFSVFGREVTGAGGSYCIRVDMVEQHLSDISPRAAGNSGQATLALAGIPFADPMSVQLRAVGRPTVTADSVTLASATSLCAGFRLTGTATGVYDVIVIWPGGGEARLTNAFTVVGGIGARLEARLRVPAAVRPERQYAIWLEYANTGDADLPAPLFMVSSPSGTPFGLATEELAARPLQLLGVNPAGPAGVLPPGFSNAIPLYFRSTAWDADRFEYRVIPANSAAVDWSALGADYRPPEYVALMDQFWAEVRQTFGTTWAEYQSALSEGATRYSAPDAPVYPLSSWFELLLHEAVISGTLASPMSGADITSLNMPTQCDLPPANEAVQLWVRRYGQYFPLSKATAATLVDPSQPTTIIVHGYRSDRNADWVISMAEAIASRRGGNVLVVDWGQWAWCWLPAVVGRLTEAAGTQAGIILKDAVPNIDRKQVHIIGHSFGAYVGAAMSAWLGRVGRLTALDPAPQHLAYWVPPTFLSLVGLADFVDSYKSSRALSTRGNVANDALALQSVFERRDPDYQHGYAIEWYHRTIIAPGDYGFSWDQGSVARQGFRDGLDANKGWLGLVYLADTREIVSCWDMRNDPGRYPESSQWRYKELVPAVSYDRMVKNLEKVVELEAKILLPAPGAPVRTGDALAVQVRVDNHADNGVLVDSCLLFRQPQSYVQMYLSEDEALSSDDYCFPGHLPGMQILHGENVITNGSVQIPQVEPGEWHLISRVMLTDAKAELYEPNNVAAVAINIEQSTPIPSPTGTPSPTPSVTGSPSPTPSPTGLLSPTPSPTHTPSPTPTPEPIPTPPQDYPVPPDGPSEGGGASPVIRPRDPNEKTGPAGLGVQRTVALTDTLQFTIYFENVITASAPAQEVVVVDDLDPNLDWSSLRFSEVAFGDRVVALDDSAYALRRQEIVPDYRPEVTRTWTVDIAAEISPLTGRAQWTLRTLDPETGDLPEDARAGFLPPNDATHRGEGHLSYSIQPKPGVAAGTVISNAASIVFDTNEAIATNVVTNTLGAPATPPSGVALGGPAGGIIGASYAFTAAVAPLGATTPITYTWRAPGQSTVTHTLGLTDTQSYTWASAGTQYITVTAANEAGAITGTYVITISAIAPTGVVVSGPASGITGAAYTFGASVSPLTTTTPITYTWTATGLASVIHGGGGRSDSVSFTWPSVGTKTVAVTARNAAGQVVGSRNVAISLAMWAPAPRWSTGFAPTTGWSSQDAFPRALADVNGDSRADVVGFGAGGTWVSLSTGSALGAMRLWSPSFGSSVAAGSWVSQTTYPRMLGDVNGDGKADVVGFGAAGVYVAPANAVGTAFGPMSKWSSSFGFLPAAGSWTTQDRYPRLLGDVNGDGKADIVGFGAAGVYVSLATPTGIGTRATTFGPMRLWSPSFGYLPAAGNWTSQNTYPRLLADVNGDGKADIVGFGGLGAYVSLSTGSGFGTMTRWSTAFGTSTGWTTQDTYPRGLADVNADGKADIVGYGAAGAYYASSKGTSFGAITLGSGAFGFLPAAGGWSGQNQYPRFAADMNHDHKADLVGFGAAGVYVGMHY